VTPPEIAWADVCGRRVARHHLGAPAGPDHLVEVVGAMCGAHSQMPAAAEVSVALRVEGATRGDVRRAVEEDRTLVRTYGPRGTVHLLPARDLAWWCGALASLPPPNRQAEAVRLSDDQTDAVVDAIAVALRAAPDGLTVDELGEQVIARTGPWAGDPVLPAFQQGWPRWRQAMATAAFRGALCFGPTRGRRTTYASPTAWVPGLVPLDGTEALPGVVRAYLAAFGPATTAQVARWLASTVGPVATALRTLADEVVPVRIAGQDEEAWALAGDTGPHPPAEGLRLLPHFDAYAVGAHPRPLVFPGRASERALAGGQAGPVPVVLRDGVVAGVWHQRRSGRRLAVTVELLPRVTKALRAGLDAQVARLGEIVGAEPELTLGPVTAGPHL
jgi:hypothetical protein